MYLRQRQSDLAVGSFRRRPHHRSAAGVVSLKPGPAQRTLGVLMIEKVDQTDGLVSTAEVSVQTAGQLGNQTRIYPAASRGDRVALEQQVVGQHDPVARRDRPDMVPAVRVEGHERQRLLRDWWSAPIRRLRYSADSGTCIRYLGTGLP